MTDEETRRPSSETGTAALRAGWSHGHRDVSGGWLRPTVFGAVDGLVTNASLIAGLGGGQASAHTIVLTGVAALVAGAFSMGTGEYISVTNQNELVHAEVALEQKMHAMFPVAEQEELAGYFREYGADPETAARMAAAVSKDPGRCPVGAHPEELGRRSGRAPSPPLAGFASLCAFSLGALVPAAAPPAWAARLAATLIITAVALVTGGMVVGLLTGRFGAALRAPASFAGRAGHRGDVRDWQPHRWQAWLIASGHRPVGPSAPDPSARPAPGLVARPGPAGGPVGG